MDDVIAPTRLWRLVDRDGSFHVLPESVTLLGREGCHIVANSRSVDLKHAIITYDHCTSCFKIKDLSSLNGTYVNDTRIPEQTYVDLKDGDHLRLGYDATVYRVEMAARSPHAFSQHHTCASALATDAGSDWSTDPADAAGWITLRASASNPPVVAECQGCIKEQLLHHICDDNAEDARQAGAWHSSRTGGSRSPTECSRSPLLTSPVAAALRSTWDRKSSPESAAVAVALSSPPRLPRAGSPQAILKSLPMAEVHGPAAAAAASSPLAAARGTPLYGQPAWWGDDAQLPEAAAAGQRVAQDRLAEGGGSGGISGRRPEHALGAKPAAGRPATLFVEQQTTHPHSNGSLAAGDSPSISSASPGKTREPAMPGTAFTVNFNNSNKADQDEEEAVSPKVGDSLSCFMPEQLRQSLRMRNKKPEAKDQKPQPPAATADDAAKTTLKSASPTLAAAKVKKAGKTRVASDGSSIDATGGHPMHGTRAAAAASERVVTAPAKSEGRRTVPSPVAFLMRKMYDDKRSDREFTAAVGDIGDAAATPPQLLAPRGPTSGLGVGRERNDCRSDDESDAVSEAGTYTVDAGEARSAPEQRSDSSSSELSSWCSDQGEEEQEEEEEEGYVSRNGSLGAVVAAEAAAADCGSHRQPEEPAIGSRSSRSGSGASHRTACDGVAGDASSPANSNGNGCAELDEQIYSSLSVEVGRWSAALDVSATTVDADRGDSSEIADDEETVRLSRPGRRAARDRDVRISNAAVSDREVTERGGAPSLLASELSLDSKNTATSGHSKLAEAVAAMSASGAIASRTVISPVEHDVELYLGAGRGDDSAPPVRRARREAASELSKERLLQELGIGDAPIQATVERPKLVQELLSSRKHHREDDPVIVSKSKNFFEKIRTKSDQEPSSGKQSHTHAAAVAVDDRRSEAKHPALHRLASAPTIRVGSDSASLGSTAAEAEASEAAATAAWGGDGVNGHHRHSAIGLSIAIGDGSSDGAPGRGEWSRHAADRHPGQRYVDKLAALSRGEPLPDDSPRDGETTARTETNATARTDVLLQPTDEFVRSMSAKRSSAGGLRHAAAASGNGVLPQPAASHFDSDAANKAPGSGDFRSDRLGRVERPNLPPQQQQPPERERTDARPPRQPSGTALRQGISGAGADVGGARAATTSEALAMSWAASRSGRSSTDSLASRGSSDGGGLLLTGATRSGGGGNDKSGAKRAALQQQHVRHGSDSSAAASAARAAAAAVPQPSAAAAGSAARPNRTFELRRARTLAAAPDPVSDRSSARSSSGAGSSVDGSGGSQQHRSRSGSLERTSEVSLGVRIVQRSRQTAGGAGAGGGSGGSSNVAFAPEVRGAKVSLAAKPAAASAGSLAFSRSDGGRFSMRVSSASTASAGASAKADSKARQQLAARKSIGAEGGSGSSSTKSHGRLPTAAAAVAAAASLQAKAELERDRAAWERRRSYDPRKAAAAATAGGSGGLAGSSSCASSASSTPRQQSLGSRASSGTASPVTPIALRQQQQQQNQQLLLLDRVGGSSSACSLLATPSGTAADAFGGDDDDYSRTADYDGGGGADGSELTVRRSAPPPRVIDPAAAAEQQQQQKRARASCAYAGTSAAAASASAQHELQIAKMSSELAKDLELLSRGTEEEEDEDNDDTDGGGDWGTSSVGADVGSTVEPSTPGGRRDSAGSSCCDEMAAPRGERVAAAAVAAQPLPRPRLSRDFAGSDVDEDSSLPDTYRAGYDDDDASEAAGRPDSGSDGGKSAFTSYSAFTEPGLTPPGKANSPALSPVKKKVVEVQSEENGGLPQIPDPNYDSVMVSSIKHISNRLSKSTSRILTRLREKVDLPSAHSSEEEAEAADRAAETLLGDQGGGTGTELPGSQELAAALRTLRRAERNVRAVERALFTNDSYPEITPTVTTHERDHYLAEIRRIRDEITGFKPIASMPASSAEEIRKVSTAAAGMSLTATATAATRVLASKPAGFTTVKSLTGLKKTYY